MQTAPDPRAELERLRKIKRLRELEAKASGQPVAPAGPSLRSETDAIIEEAAAAIPGGYEAFNRKPADPQRMAAMGYVQDPLAKSGYAKPRAPEAPTVNTAPSSNYLTDVVRGLEAPIVGLTGGGLEGWAKTTAQDPVLGATQAVEFISPVDDAARAYQGLKQAGAGLIDGDMQKAAEGAQQFAIDGSFTAMQALPGSMTLRGVTGVATPGRNTLALNMADLERSAVQATRAPPVRKAPPAPVVAAEPPKPFSAPAEPAGGGLVRRNADRFIGGAVGATIGGAGDAYAAPADGEGDGGPLNATTGAAIGFFGPRAVASAASRGFRAAARPFRPAGMDERVAARAVRNALKAGGITNADEASAAFTARFGDKPAAIADLTQEGVSTAAGLSRRAGATGEAARARGEELLQNRAGRLERDIGQANPNLNPATITGDVERMVALAQEQAQPAYSALRQGYPLGSLTSPRLEQLSQVDSMAPHIKAVNDYRATTAATEGRVVGDFEYWDLVKRDIDAKEQQLIAAGATMDDIRLRKLEDTRNALVQELDTLVPDYAAARQLGGEAPKMRESMRQGQRILGQYQTAEEVARLVAGITGQAQLTALQAGVIRSMVQKTEGATGAMASLMSAGSRRKLSEVFGPEAAEALQARFAADAAIVQNAQRINPNIGSVTSQAQMGEGGFLPMAAEAIRAFRSPIEATLAAMSKGGAYSKAQRDLMGQMLLEGATPENLARIFGNRGGRSGRPAPPPPPTGGGAGPVRGPTVPPAPTGAAPRARPAPSEEAVLSAMAQVTQPAKGRPMVGPPTRDTIWDGPVPTKPQSLRGWIRSQGGINDRNYMTGDMKAVMGRANGMPGLINRESGTGLDELARKAYQEGFDVDPEDAGTLMRLLEEEFAGSPSYRIGAKEEWEAYQDTLRARRGNVPGQTSSSPPMIGGAALGALTSGGATYAATGDEDLAFKAGILGGIGGGVVGSRFGKGSTPKPPAVKPKPAFDQRFMKEAQRLVSYNGGVDKALKAQQYVIDQLKNSKAPNAQDRLNRAVSVQYAIRRMAERSNRELDEIVPMADTAPTGPKPIDPNTNYNIDPRGDKFVIRTDAGEEVLGAPQFTDRKQALAWLQGETRKARQGGAATSPRPGPPGVKPPPVKPNYSPRHVPAKLGSDGLEKFVIDTPQGPATLEFAKFDKSSYQIESILAPEGARGKGVGVALYEALAKRAAAKGMRITSDSSISPEAGQVYEALARRGYDVRRADDVVMDNMRNKKLTSQSGESVYTIYPIKPPPVKNGLRGNAEAIGAGTGAVFAPDADRDGEISFGERAGAAITGGVLGNIARRASGTGAQKVKPPMRGADQAGLGGRPKPPAPRNAPPKGPSFPPRLAADLNKFKVSPATRATLDQNAALPPGERKSVMEATGWNDEILRIAAPYIRPGSRMESEIGNRIARLVQDANANPVEYALRQTMAKGAYEEAQKRFKQASGARSRAARNLEDLRSRNMLNPNQPATQQQLTVHKQRRDDAEQFLSEAARLRDEAKVMLDRADVELMSLTQVRDFANKEIQRITDALGGQRPKASATAMLPAYNPLGPPKVGGAASLLPPKPPGGRPSKRAADELAHLLFEQDMAEKFAKIQSGEITPTQRNTFQQVMSWYARHPSLAAVSAVAAGGSAVGYAALATDQGERAVQARENARKRSGQPEPELPGPPAWDWEKLSRNPRFAGDTQAALQALGYKIGKIDNNIRRADGKRTESEKALYHFLWTMDNTRDPEAPPTEAEWDALKEAALQARRKR